MRCSEPGHRAPVAIHASRGPGRWLVRPLHRADRATILGASESAMHMLRRSGRVGVLDLSDLRRGCAHLRGGRHCVLDPRPTGWFGAW